MAGWKVTAREPFSKSWVDYLVIRRVNSGKACLVVIVCSIRITKVVVSQPEVALVGWKSSRSWRLVVIFVVRCTFSNVCALFG